MMKGNDQKAPLLGEKDKEKDKKECCGERNFEMINFPNIYKLQIIFNACVGFLY